MFGNNQPPKYITFAKPNPVINLVRLKTKTFKSNKILIEIKHFK